MHHRPEHDRQLALIDRARTALAQAATLSQVKTLLDTATAAEVFARRQKLSDDVVGYAHALKIDALTKLGRMLRRMPKHAGGRPSKTGSRSEQVSLSTLKISRKTSMTAQRIAALPAAMRRALANRMRSLHDVLLAHRRSREAASRPPLPAGKFRVLYCDPPWSGRLLTGDYPTMSLDELCALPVGDLAADDAVLFLWATAPLLEDAFKVIHAWGFSYRTGCVWDKGSRHLPGNYVSTRHEHLLICTRGTCLPDQKRPMLPSVFHYAPSKRHSEKPAEVRAFIERLYLGPRVELFSRHKVPGWTAWGNDPILIAA